MFWQTEKGFLCAGPTKKNGSLIGADQVNKRGGGGFFTAIHTYRAYLYIYMRVPPPPPGATPGCISNTVRS